VGAQHTIEVLVLHVVQQIVGIDEEGYRRPHRRSHSVRTSRSAGASLSFRTSFWAPSRAAWTAAALAWATATRKATTPAAALRFGIRAGIWIRAIHRISA